MQANAVQYSNALLRNICEPVTSAIKLPPKALPPMNVVALRSPMPDSGTFPAIDGRIARIEVFDDMAAAEPYWRALERANSLATPYQGYDFLKFWQRHVGTESAIAPFIVVAFNALGVPLFLLPFGCRKLAGLRVVEFLGGKHSNFNMGLWRREAAAKIGADELGAVLSCIAARADIVKLISQPLTWAGASNPLALLPHQRSASFCFSGSLAPDFKALLRARTNAVARKKMRKKERTLAGYGKVRFGQTSGVHEIRRVLDTFFKQKSARMRAQGAPDAFAAPGVRRFIEAAAGQQADGTATIELYALSVDDIIVATMGGIVGNGRFCAMFNSIAQGPYAVQSPGEQLIVRLVQACCERGLDTFDLGIGKAHYKNLFCGDAEPLFDSYLPLSAGGRLLAFAFATAARVRRTIKQHPALWSLVCAMRRLRSRAFPAP
ncbi:MAG: GNAT family N-acetyltransferase [Deltaproteobacteria bacterium]|nr:GNAT family N-acetyltransferase [Deltaproteobacteria bacterium]